MKKSIKRRDFIKFGSAVGVGSIATGLYGLNTVPTPPQTEGPFFPIQEQDDKDIDMTRVIGRDEVAQGEVIIVKGVVMNIDEKPLAGIMVDIWQACATGRYDHPADPNPAPVDPNFQYWARFFTDANGLFRFKTIIPGAYPATSSWLRPPHLHFKFSSRNKSLTTQMYFKGNNLNAIDNILIDTKNRFGQEAHDSLIIDFNKVEDEEHPTGFFKVVLDRTPSL